MNPSPSLAHTVNVPRFIDRAGPTRSVRAAHVETLWELPRILLYGIVLTRASVDPVIDLLGGDDSSMGVGAILNALAIASAFSLLLRRPLTAPFNWVAD